MANKLYKPLLIDSIKAVVNVEQNRFIGFGGNYCGAGEKALGVCDVPTEAGQLAPVGVIGIFLVEAGENISAGDEITSDATGKAVKVARSEQINGYSLDTASVGALIRVVRGI
ncbi:DUF2190 family protein [bacterium]|nr:DUF2190 family protein [bacterium]